MPKTTIDQRIKALQQKQAADQAKAAKRKQIADHRAAIAKLQGKKGK